MPQILHADEIKKGEAHFEAGDYEAALDVFQKVLAQDPENAYALNDAGLTAAELGQFVAAAEYFEQALTTHPENAPAFFNLIDLLANEGEVDLAREAFQAYEAGIPDSEEKKGYRKVLLAQNDVHHADVAMAHPPYYMLLKYIHDTLRPDTYVEIGVQTGASLSLASSHTTVVGIDPDLQLRLDLPENIKLFEQTSDDFFDEHDLQAVLDQRTVDLAFIDGMHLFEYALRDFINLERNCTSQSVILVHDCFPASAETASRERTTQMWSGDIWKLILCLKEYRPDLNISTVDIEPTGLGIVTNLDPHSHDLEDNMEVILEEYVNLEYNILNRNKDSLLNRIATRYDRVRDILLFDRPRLEVPNVTILSSSQIGRYSTDAAEVSVLMPTTDLMQALQTAQILRDRAGMSCEIFIIEDERRKGFIQVINESFQHIKSDYYVFLAQDVFPSRNWLKIAYDQMKADDAGLFAFNDGKWSGQHAAYGMVDREWLLSVYDDTFFHPSYHSHAADTELTMIAIEQGKLTCNLSAILMEVDYHKDYKTVNMQDKNLLHQRKHNGFDGHVHDQDVLRLYS